MMRMMSILCLMIILHSGVGNPMSDQECPEGRTGIHTGCEFCDDGYYGDPLGYYGYDGVRECQKCECNNNVNEHAIANCHRIRGKCLKCIFDTAGWNCDKCKEGFYGDALAQNCQPCNHCHPKGTWSPMWQPNEVFCHDRTGRCNCKPNVVGFNCDRCKDGFFNIDSELGGCDRCYCDSMGSLNETCNALSGQCHCRPGVTGQRCDQCEPNYYDFSMDGCTPCNCDPSGSVDLQCKAWTGQCLCKDNVWGRMCDKNYTDMTDEEIQGGQGSSLLIKEAKKGNLDTVKQLVELGVNVNSKEYGYSALQEAAGKGHLEVVKYLHSHGADILTGLSTPLWLAAHHGHLPVVEYLADNGAPLETPSLTHKD